MPIEACRPAYRQPRIGDLQAGQETECDPLWTCGQRKGVDHMSTAATTSAEGFNNSSHTKILTLPAQHKIKVFWFFFSKKNCFSFAYLPLSAPQSRVLPCEPASAERPERRRQTRAVIRIRDHFNCFGLCRVRVNNAGKRAQADPGAYRER